MLSEEKSAQEEIYNFLKETNTIYNMCKKYSILIEEILPKHKAPIHAANELKSLVFHLYNVSQFPHNTQTNILEAKEHLCRAFYDLHSIIISIYIEQIKIKLSSYKSTTIIDAFPEYGKTIRPAIKNIQELLQKIRSNRNTDIALINSNITAFDQQVTALSRFDDIIESKRLQLNKYESEKEKKGWKFFILSLTIILIVAVLFFGLGYYLASDNSDAQKNNIAPIQSKDSIKP